MTGTWLTALLAGSFALAAYAVADSKGKDIKAWAILLTDLAFLLPRLG